MSLAQDIFISGALAKAMVPSVGDYFRSFYYPSTHLSSIDLDQSITQHSCPHPNVVEVAQRLVALPGVQKVLSDPFSFQPDEITRRNKVLQDQKFQILAQKSIIEIDPEMIHFYGVSEHPDLPGWVIKAAGHRVPQDQMVLGLINDHGEMNQFTAFESLLRLTMNQRIRQVARDLEIDLVVPDEYAVPYLDPGAGDASRRYFVISKKLPLKSKNEPVSHISGMSSGDQRELARKISLLIKNIGFADASFDNIRFTEDGRLAFIDTEPAGLLVAKGDPLHTKGHSVEKCARIGLFKFKTSADQRRLDGVSQEVDRHYQKSLKEVSITRIVLSIICPLIPLVLLVIAVVNKIRIGKIVQQIFDERKRFRSPQASLMTLGGFDVQQLQLACQTQQVQPKPLRERYCSAIEGVVFPATANLGSAFA